jgi:AdoMet-dependent rRNA methyltransferase SPB1
LTTYRFLHDGAPNVGTSWIQDAFFQSELTLSALKLATEFLMPGGTFVSKVFRSKDYNKLMWVFNQLFGRVEATKPSSSRNVSAEIFVVCRDFLAPKKIDPRILDPSYVFKEIDDMVVDDSDDNKKIKEKQGAVINNIFHPEKKRRHRDGYEDGDYTLHSSTPVSEFVKSSEYLDILARSTCLSFDEEDDDAQKLAQHPLTTEDIKVCCLDLKVIGKKDFKTLIKWREALRIDLGLAKSRKEIHEEKKKAAEEATAKEECEGTLEERLAAEAEQAQLTSRKVKKKQRERKAKQMLKMRLGMDTPHDIGLEASQLGVGDFEVEDPTMTPFKSTTLSQGSAGDSGSDEDSFSEIEAYDSDEEVAMKIGALDDEMEGLFSEYLSRKSKKDPAQVVKKVKEGAAKDFEEWYGMEYDKQVDEYGGDDKSDGSDSGSDPYQDTSSDEDEPDRKDLSASKLSSKAKLFFNNPVFKSLQPSEKGLFEKDMMEEDTSDDEEVFRNAKEQSRKNKRKRKDQDENEGDKDFELVPLEEPASDGDEAYAIETAQEYTIAQQMIRTAGKRDMIDGAYNRYSFNDPDLPSWFVMDESKHNKPTLPVTKQAIEVIRQRQMAMNARPIKKVAEAKFRKKTRALRRIEKMMKKAESLNDEEDLSEKSKLTKIATMMNKAKKDASKEREKPKLVVAKGMNRGQKGRPKGVKGRYKMVDPRMKKELRADKRAAKTSKKRR